MRHGQRQPARGRIYEAREAESEGGCVIYILSGLTVLANIVFFVRVLRGDGEEQVEDALWVHLLALIVIAGLLMITVAAHCMIEG